MFSKPPHSASRPPHRVELTIVSVRSALSSVRALLREQGYPLATITTGQGHSILTITMHTAVLTRGTSTNSWANPQCGRVHLQTERAIVRLHGCNSRVRSRNSQTSRVNRHTWHANV